MKKILIALAACSAFTVPASAANLLTNGSFETGDFTGWTLTNSESSTGTGAALPVVIGYGNNNQYPTGAYGESIPADNAPTNPGFDPVGGYGAYFVSDFANPQTLSQAVSLAAGTSYTFGFDLYVPFNGAANPNGATFTGSVGGIPIATIVAGNETPGLWKTYSGAYTFVAAQSGDFMFSFTANGFPAKDFVIDRVYLAATNTVPGVPEPATWAMMLTGFGLVGSALRRRTAVAAVA